MNLFHEKPTGQKDFETIDHPISIKIWALVMAKYGDQSSRPVNFTAFTNDLAIIFRQDFYGAHSSHLEY